MPVTPPRKLRLLGFGAITAKLDIFGRDTSGDSALSGVENVCEKKGTRRSPVKAHPSWETEIIPDSEDERKRCGLTAQSSTSTLDPMPSSDDDLFASKELLAATTTAKHALASDDPFLIDMPGSWPAEPTPKSKGLTAPIKEWTPRSSPQITKTRKFDKRRRCIEDMSSSDSDLEFGAVLGKGVIELDSDGSPLRPIPQAKPTKAMSSRPGRANKDIPPPTKSGEKSLPLFEDDDEEDNRLPELWIAPESDNDDDGALIIFNEPRIKCKPLRAPEHNTTLAPRTPRKPRTPSSKTKGIRSGVTGSDSPAILVDLTSSPILQRIDDIPATPTSKTSPAKQQPPRTRKRAQAAAEQARRETYAQELFDELNRTVFGSKLPEDTKLLWNKRLLTTAGRAQWRSHEGVETTSIELAQKILDCDERIRNTLSHEMCHLATWVIDRNPKENHGKLWTRWADKVMRKRPEIEITTKHDYEISYPYEWECGNCSKIYGRFTRSIRPDECLCGVCRVGKLQPLFTTRARATPKSKTPKASKMAADKPRDSPMRTPRTGHPTLNSGDSDEREVIEIFSDSEGEGVKTDVNSEQEVDALVNEMSKVTVADD